MNVNKKILTHGILFIIGGALLFLYLFGGYFFEQIPLREFGETRRNSQLAAVVITTVTFFYGVYLLISSFLSKNNT